MSDYDPADDPFAGYPFARACVGDDEGCCGPDGPDNELPCFECFQLRHEEAREARRNNSDAETDDDN